MFISITSRDNKTLKLIRSLKTKKGRMEHGLYFAEGVRIVEEALSWAKDEIDAFLVSETFFEKNKNFVQGLDKMEKTVYTAKENLFREVCDTEAPQGIGVVMKIPENGHFDHSKANFVLVLDGVSEPGNLGTIIRTAEAAGVDGVVLMKGCADLYNPKVVRSTMGSLFRVPSLTGASLETVSALKIEGFTVVATALQNSLPIGEVRVTGKRALVVGSEAFGISPEVLRLADLRVHIPMEGQVESLNAGVAAGISMYLLKG